jgi:hypothetical protein
MVSGRHYALERGGLRPQSSRHITTPPPSGVREPGSELIDNALYFDLPVLRYFHVASYLFIRHLRCIIVDIDGVIQ